MTTYAKEFERCETDVQVEATRRRLRSDLDAEIEKVFGPRKRKIADYAKQRTAEIREALDRETHERVKDWRAGETIHMRAIDKMQMDLSTMRHINNFHGVTKGVFYGYQPRKQLVWIVFPKGKVTGSQWQHKGKPLQPFTLHEVRMYDMRRTDVGG